MADRNGSLFRRVLRWADRFSDWAMRFGLLWEKTPESRSSALLFSVTRWDQRFFLPRVVAMRLPPSKPVSNRGEIRMLFEIENPPPRYSFILNPYRDVRLSKCPLCQRLTHGRKFALFIHLAKAHPVVLGKTCRY